MHCQIVLGDVILPQRSDFHWVFELLLENSSITIFPNVPSEVDYDPVKRPLLRPFKGSSASSPIVMDGSVLVYVTDLGNATPIQ